MTTWLLESAIEMDRGQAAEAAPARRITGNVLVSMVKSLDRVFALKKDATVISESSTTDEPAA